MKRFFDTEFLENQLFGSGGQVGGVDREAEEALDRGGESADTEEAGEELWDGEEAGNESWNAEEDEGIPVDLTLSLADGSSLTCRVSGVFMEQDEEYIALETEDGMIYLMGLSQGEEDELKLRLLEDEQEKETAMAAFFRMLEEEDYAARERYGYGPSETEPWPPKEPEQEIKNENMESEMKDNDRD